MRQDSSVTPAVGADSFLSAKGVRGFTLVELMFTVAVAGLLFAIAAPSFVGTMKNSRLTTTANDLVASLQLARSEASKRGVPVTICRTADSDAPDCGSGAGWQAGWIVFTDTAANAQFDNGTDEVLYAQTPTAKQVAVNAHSVLADSMTYRGNGFPSFGLQPGPVDLVICDDRNDDRFARVLNISNTGRPRVLSGAANVPGALTCGS